MNLFEEIENSQPSFKKSDYFDPDLIEIVELMMEKDPVKRITIK